MNSTLVFTGIITIISVLIACLWDVGRDRNKTTVDACRKFRSAFSEAEAILDNGTTDAHAVMSKFSAQHDAAIVEFCYHVRHGKRKSFDAAWEKYRQCRQKINPGLLRYYEAQATGKTIDSSSTQKLMEAIKELLAFANKG